MLKSDIDLVVLKIALHGQIAIDLKLYKDGRIFRQGNGMLPALRLGCLSYVGDPICFDFVISEIPGQLLLNPINYKEPTPNGALEYFIAFYNSNSIENDKTIENTDKALATGARFLLDNKTAFNHSILGLIDRLAIELSNMTKRWYFDVYMKYVFDATSTNFPQKNSFNGPKTEVSIIKDYKNFMNQMIVDRRGKSITEIIKNKRYMFDGKLCKIAMDKANRITFEAIN